MIEHGGTGYGIHSGQDFARRARCQLRYSSKSLTTELVG